MGLEIEEQRGAWLRLPCCADAVHPVIIESHDDRYMIISAPKAPHETWVERPTEPVSMVLGWSDEEDSTILECRFVPEGHLRVEPGESWTLEILAANNYGQRRRYRRVNTNAVAHLLNSPTGEPIAVSLVDISEAGMRCRFTDFVPENRDAPMRFAIKVDGAVLLLLANMRWSGRIGPYEVQAGFEFQELHEASQTHLRAHVMQQLSRR